MGKFIKLALTTITIGGGYYIYQSQITGKRADILAKQDFNRITSSLNGTNSNADDWKTGAEQQWKNAQKEANKQWNQVSQNARDIYDSANKQISEITDKEINSIKNSELSNQSKSWYNTITGWFGKK